MRRGLHRERRRGRSRPRPRRAARSRAPPGSAVSYRRRVTGQGYGLRSSCHRAGTSPRPLRRASRLSNGSSWRSASNCEPDDQRGGDRGEALAAPGETQSVGRRRRDGRPAHRTAADSTASASARRGPIRGRLPMTCTDDVADRRSPAAAHQPGRLARAGSTPEAPASSGRSVPKTEPRSPSPPADSSASHAACATTSPSECPSQPAGSSGQSQPGQPHRPAGLEAGGRRRRSRRAARPVMASPAPLPRARRPARPRPAAGRAVGSP